MSFIENASNNGNSKRARPCRSARAPGGSWLAFMML
jgi:hypothetical protein